MKKRHLAIKIISLILFINTNTAVKGENSNPKSNYVIYHRHSNNSLKFNNSSTQCKAIAKSTKKRCKNKTTNPSGYCRVHGG